MAETHSPGISVSQVARRYDLNANLIFRWRRDPRYRPETVADDAPSFLPVEVVPEPFPPPAALDGRIEIALSSRHRVTSPLWSAGTTSIQPPEGVNIAQSNRGAILNAN